MARNSGGIYVPQTGTIYPSIAAASKALGVDASNIGKVVRGARVSAGGYNFQCVDPSADPSLLRDIDEALREQSTPKQRERMEKTRKKNEGRLSPEERQRRKEKRASVQRLHNALVTANKAIRELQKQGVADISDPVTQLENIKAIVGTNKIGGFDTSIKNLMDLNIDIEATIAAVEIQTERMKKTPAEKLKKKRAAVAFQLGVSEEELDKYNDALPLLWQLLALARQQQEKGYSVSLYDAVVDAVQFAKDPEELQRILEETLKEYRGRLEDETGEDLDDILQRGAEKLQGKYKTPEEAAQEEGTNPEAAQTLADVLKDEGDEEDWMSSWVELPTDNKGGVK